MCTDADIENMECEVDVDARMAGSRLVGWMDGYMYVCMNVCTGRKGFFWLWVYDAGTKLGRSPPLPFFTFFLYRGG